MGTHGAFEGERQKNEVGLLSHFSLLNIKEAGVKSA